MKKQKKNKEEKKEKDKKKKPGTVDPEGRTPPFRRLSCVVCLTDGRLQLVSLSVGHDREYCDSFSHSSAVVSLT